MREEIDRLWVLALASKCSFTPENVAFFLTVAVLVWLAIAVLYWSRPGGPAWGKYYFSRTCFGFGLFTGKKMIPGPRGFPVIGSMVGLMSGKVAHRRIAAAAESARARRLMAFSLGETRVVVTCHPEVAKEILHSSVFADRPVDGTAYGLMFNRAMGFAPYGTYWRMLRRIAHSYLFNPRQTKRAEEHRRVVVSQMVNVLSDRSEGTSEFEVREVLKTASLNNMMRTVFGKAYLELEQLKELVEEGYQLLGELNWSDHLPWLANFDGQNIRFRCSELVPKVNRLLNRIVDQHRRQIHEPPQSFLDVLLSLDGNDKLPESDMVAVLWEMIFRGTDTVAVLVEWILARMVMHHDVQSTVQKELDRVVGRSRAVEETDLASLPYLTAVIKEVLRLHPPGPLLSWSRLANTDTTVDGNHVPAGTTAMVNMWAIARDPQLWDDPDVFRPQRFVGPGAAEFSVLGSDLRLAPFGSGKRVCPGKNVGLAAVSFWTATLLHEFGWRRIDEAKPLDTSEVLRLSCEMARPLAVKLRPRRSLVV